jgi:hypothetical protein
MGVVPGRRREGIVLMPIHDWTRVDAGQFHHSHQRWTSALCDSLNTGGLPPGYFTPAERVLAGPIPDVVTLSGTSGPIPAFESTAAGAVLSAPSRTRYVSRAEVDAQVRKANRVTVRDRQGHIVAVLETVSPGN